MLIPEFFKIIPQKIKSLDCEAFAGNEDKLEKNIPYE